jgi:hypothetical protein
MHSQAIKKCKRYENKINHEEGGCERLRPGGNVWQTSIVPFSAAPEGGSDSAPVQAYLVQIEIKSTRMTGFKIYRFVTIVIGSK